MSDFFWFSDAQWERIAPLLPTDVRGKQRVDDRRVLSGIVHALRCGGRWADCADVYRPKKTLYSRFVRWSERGIWEGIFSALAGAADAPIGCTSTAVASRSIAARAEEKGGLGSWYRPHQRRGNTKLHAVCDSKGRPVVLLLTPGNVHDCKVARRCIEAMPPSIELVADKGYDSQACASGSTSAEPRPSSRHARTAKSNMPSSCLKSFPIVGRIPHAMSLRSTSKARHNSLASLSPASAVKTCSAATGLWQSGRTHSFAENPLVTN